MPRPSSYVEPSVNGFSASAGRVRRHHVGVHHEPAGGDHDGARRDHAGLVEGPPREPDHGAGVGDHEVGRAGLVADLDAGLLHPGAEQVHHHPGALGVARHRHLVAARRRHRLLLVGPDLLVAGEHQPLGAGLDDRLLGVVGALELEAERLQPVEVLDRAVAVRADLVVLGLLGDRDEVGVHLVGASPPTRSPAARRCRRRGRSGRRTSTTCRRARPPARAAAPARPPGPPRAPRSRRRCRSRPRRRRTARLPVGGVEDRRGEEVGESRRSCDESRTSSSSVRCCPGADPHRRRRPGARGRGQGRRPAAGVDVCVAETPVRTISRPGRSGPADVLAAGRRRRRDRRVRGDPPPRPRRRPRTGADAERRRRQPGLLRRPLRPQAGAGHLGVVVRVPPRARRLAATPGRARRRRR